MSVPVPKRQRESATSMQSEVKGRQAISSGSVCHHEVQAQTDDIVGQVSVTCKGGFQPCAKYDPPWGAASKQLVHLGYVTPSLTGETAH